MRRDEEDSGGVKRRGDVYSSFQAIPVTATGVRESSPRELHVRKHSPTSLLLLLIMLIKLTIQHYIIKTRSNNHGTKPKYGYFTYYFVGHKLRIFWINIKTQCLKHTQKLAFGG